MQFPPFLFTPPLLRIAQLRAAILQPSASRSFRRCVCQRGDVLESENAEQRKTKIENGGGTVCIVCREQRS